MTYLEYAQNRNGRFVSWIEGGVFQDRDAALKFAASRGLKAEGDDFLLTEYDENDGGGAEERFCRNAFDR